MSRTIQDIMTPAPVTLPTTASLRAAAQIMRDSQIGAVLVVDEADRLVGVVTDRDLVVRGIAGRSNVRELTVGEVASPGPVTVGPQDKLQTVVELMRLNGIRRIPVAEGVDAIGIVSLGDLARDQDPTSALAEISALPANN